MSTSRRSTRLRLLVTLPLLAAVASVAGCSSDPEPEADLATRLEKDTGVKWTVYVDPRNQEIRFLAPAKPVRLGDGTAEEQARAFFARYRDALHAPGNDADLPVMGESKDTRGGVHLRFAHVLPGTELPVFGAGTTAHFTEAGEVYWMHTDFRADLARVSHDATLSKEDAVAKALEHVASFCGSSSAAATVDGSELGVLANADQPAALTHRVEVTAHSERCNAPAIHVDARTGTVLDVEERAHGVDAVVGGSRFELLREQGDRKAISVLSTKDSAGAKFQMITDDGPSRRVITHDFKGARSISPVLESRKLLEWDRSSPAKGAAVDAHFHARAALRFLRQFADATRPPHRTYAYPLSRDVHLFVHDNSSNNWFGANAFAVIDPNTGMDVVHFGDGNFPTVPNAMPFSAAYDIVAHELTHLITMHTSKLKYEGESGALSESFSDIMGAAAEHAVVDDPTKNFLVGEDLFFAGPPGAKALRSMTAPRSVGSRDHYDNRVRCSGPPTRDNDFCAVHFNSGIANRVFSLIVEGGSLIDFAGREPKVRPLGVDHGIGWEKATYITYWAMTGLSATANFEIAALAQEAEAFRFGIEEGRVTTCAWYAVGAQKPEVTAAAFFCPLPAKKPDLEIDPPPPPPTDNPCSGRADAFVCDTSNPLQAIKCKDGAPTIPPQSVLCADLNQMCKPRSSGDPTATVDSGGALACE